jgi:hypothetical protein
MESSFESLLDMFGLYRYLRRTESEEKPVVVHCRSVWAKHDTAFFTTTNITTRSVMGCVVLGRSLRSTRYFMEPNRVACSKSPQRFAISVLIWNSLRFEFCFQTSVRWSQWYCFYLATIRVHVRILRIRPAPLSGTDGERDQSSLSMIQPVIKSSHSALNSNTLSIHYQSL